VKVGEIHHRPEEEMDGHILFFIEGSRELLPGYIKTTKEMIIPREMLRPNKHRRPQKRDRRNKKRKIKDKAVIRTTTCQDSYTIRPTGQRGNIQRKRTNNTIRIPAYIEVINTGAALSLSYGYASLYICLPEPLKGSVRIRLWILLRGWLFPDLGDYLKPSQLYKPSYLDTTLKATERG
jgi:hypothetical protein